MSDAKSSFGTLLKLGDGGGGSEVFTTVAEVKDITPIPFTADTEEVTHHSSPGGYEEHIVTILRTGEVKFAINWLVQNATHSYSAGLLKDYEDKTLRNFQLVLTDVGTTTWAFSAYVTGFEPDAPVAGVSEASITLKVTGQPTLA